MRRLLVSCAVVLLAACSDAGSDPQIIIVLQVTPSAAAVGDTITFVTTAAASSLATIGITYGDNSSESYDTGGLSNVQATFKHVYQAAGTYQVRTTATDSRSGSRSTSLSVSIQ